jgi:hypothetical protein
MTNAKELSGLSDFEPVEIPEGIEIHTSDGVFIKQMCLPRAGIFIPQHSHTYDHHSMLATGSIRVWRDDKLVGDFKAPAGILIGAGTKHTFMSLEPSVVYCIHNIERTGGVDVLEEHEFSKE